EYCPCAGYRAPGQEKVAMELEMNGVRLVPDVAERWREFAQFLGDPSGPEQPAGDGRGRVQPFARGVVVSHPETGVRALWGPIGARWQALGGTRFGYPET